MTRATLDDGDAAPTLFADMLRDRTALVHREAERAGVIADLIRARATREAYATLLRNLVPVYAALESALVAHCASPLLAAFADPALHRLSALEADLVAIAGRAWAVACPLTAAAQAYAAAVVAASDDPPRLAAHAYARYLGDLSGGQILKPVLARTLDLGADALGFYDFPRIDDIAATKARIRAAFDEVPAPGPVADRIADEAVAAFRHNIAVSEAVQSAAG